MKVAALDLGERRIGVAVSDSGGIFAFPYTVIERSGDPASDRLRIAGVLEELGAERLLVGLPLGLSGAAGHSATAARAEADELSRVVAVPVECVDERLSTVEAARRRRERHGEDARRRRRRPVGRDGIDAEAAAIILESWLSANKKASS